MSNAHRSLALLLALLASACTPPSSDGVQGKLRASLPVTGEIIFE